MDTSGLALPPELNTTDSVMFDRWVARSRLSRPVSILLIGGVLFLLPLALGLQSGVSLAELLTGYRAQFVYALIVVYGLAAMGPLERMRTDVALALRPVIRVDDSVFVSTVNRSCQVRPLAELAALGVGMLVGLAINISFEPLEPDPHPLEIYAYVSRFGIYAFASWAFFLLMTNTRMSNAILRLPSEVNIFDLRPFAPIGRHTVWLSLTGVGAVTLSLLSVSFRNEALWLEYVIVYGVLLVSVLVLFFLNTHSVHGVLSAAKQERMASVESHLTRAYERFEALLRGAGDTHVAATEIMALAAVMQEVKQARTWPYNTQLLRTAVVSVATPTVVGLSRVIPLLLTGNLF